MKQTSTPPLLPRLLLLAVSYGFYALIQPRYVWLLALCTCISFLSGRMIAKTAGRSQRLWLAAGQICLFGILFFYKYLGFFTATLLGLAGRSAVAVPSPVTPIGLSFFTFAASGYLFDVYRNKCPVEESILNYAVFLGFFPAVLSGPIGRARDFLPQLKTRDRCSIAGFRHGFLRFVTGAVKKWVIADALGIVVNDVYWDVQAYTGGLVLVAVAAYAIQIYLDFAAYSDMALGAAEMLGFRLTENFRAPYCSRTVQSFWKKWHISLTDWFREYLYFPLGGSRKGPMRTYLNILIVFTVSGLWHGAAWTFVFWGLLNGIFQVVGSATLPLRKRLHSLLHLREEHPVLAAWQGLFTFGLMAVAWVFFRADSLHQALFVLRRMAGIALHGFGDQNIFILMEPKQLLLTVLGLVLVFAVDLRFTLTKKKPLQLENRPVLLYAAAAVLLIVLGIFGNYGPGFDASSFTYFQF